MSPLIEDARRRQRRRRAAMAVLALLAALVAALAAVLHRGSPDSERQARTTTGGYVVRKAPGGAIVTLTRAGEVGALVHAVVITAARRHGSPALTTVRVDPRTGIVTATTTPAR